MRILWGVFIYVEDNLSEVVKSNLERGKNSMKRLPFLVHLSRKTRRIINLNLIFGIVFIVVGVGAAVGGIVHIILAALLHFVGSLIVIFNSARLVRFGEELDPHQAD